MSYITIASTGNGTDFGDLTKSNNQMNNGNTSSPTRGIFAGGYFNNNVIEYITIATTGNSADFGDLTQTTRFMAGYSSGNASVQSA